MRKIFVMMLLALIAALCLLGAVACSGIPSDDPGTNGPENPSETSVSEKYAEFIKLIESDTDEYSLSIIMEEGDYKIEMYCVSADGRIYQSREQVGYSWENYGWFQNDYMYLSTKLENEPVEHSVLYAPGETFGIQTLLRSVEEELFYTEDFYEKLFDSVVYENEAYTFSFESIQNGTLKFIEDAVEIDFDLLYTTDTVVTVQIQIENLGDNTYAFPFDEQEEFADITALDLLYAKMVWVLDADSAVLDINLTGDSGTGTTINIPLLYTLSAGESYCEASLTGIPTTYMGSIYKDGLFFYINEIAEEFYVTTEEYGFTIARFFENFLFTFYEQDYFQLVEGRDDQLTLSEAGKEWYVYCKSLLIDFSQEGKYIVTAELTEEAEMFESLECTISGVGEEHTIEFPERWKQYVEFYQDGIMYKDISAPDKNEVSAQKLEKYSKHLILPESIAANGKTYVVTAADSSFLDKYGYSLQTVVIPGTVTNLNGTLTDAFNLEYVYYGGTQEEFGLVQNASMPQGAVVYYYSETEPLSAGNYWHWNENKTTAVRWPGGEDYTPVYQVCFDAGWHGHLEQSYITASVIEEEPIPYSDYDEYVFEGWYTDYECSEENKVSFPYTVTEDITLYAKWMETEFYLYYNLNDNSNGYEVTGYYGEPTEVVIPSTYRGLPVTGIDEFAFSGCDSLTNIKFSTDSNIARIGDGAFSHCRSLTSVKLPAGVKSIGESAFFACTNLMDIVLPNSVTNIGMMAFWETEYYQEKNWDDNELFISNHLIQVKSSVADSYTIKQGTLCVADHAFIYCETLTNIEIPASVTSVGGAFREGCDALENIIVSESNPVYSSQNGILFNKNKTEIIHVPVAIKGELVIPDSVTSIGDFVFDGRSGLTGELMIPDSVTSIGVAAFRNCRGLAGELIIPAGVTSLANSVFSGCTGLTGKLIIPDGMTSIGSWAFEGCSGLTGELIIPNRVKYIGEQAFRDCYGLTGELIIPNSVMSIGWMTFYNCSGLTSIEIPDSVTSIGSSAFSGCSRLTSIEIPASVTSIGSDAFYGCTSLTSVTFENTSDWWRSTSSTATSGTNIPESDLADPSVAAIYLKSTYCSYYWNRG